MHARFLFILTFAVSGSAWGGTEVLPISGSPFTVTPNRNDTVVELTIPFGTWTNFEFYTDW